MKKINRIKLYIKSKDSAKKEAAIIKNKLIKSGFKIVNNKYDLALSIGGDGTFIKMIHENKFNDKIYYSGINAGSLGYLIDFEPSKIDDFIKLLKNNGYLIKESNILETKITTKTGEKTIYSFNECIIKNSNQLLINADVYLNNSLLEHFIGDGLLISTPNGSTAYNLSFGGPIVDSKLNALIITSIAPLNNKIYKSLINNLVISNNRNLVVEFDKKENVCFINDGKPVNVKSVIKIECSLNKKLKHITLNKDSFAEKINKKIIN